MSNWILLGKGISVILVLLSLMMLNGCRAWAPPPSVDHNPQPWAQQESWQGRSSLPGFGSGLDSTY